jgi:hypothetical protein
VVVEAEMQIAHCKVLQRFYRTQVEETRSFVRLLALVRFTSSPRAERSSLVLVFSMALRLVLYLFDY